MTTTSQLKPDFAVFLDGEKVAPPAAAAILGIRVYRSRGAASAFELTISDPEGRLQDDPLFLDCRSVRIDLGTVGKLATVFDGEVTAWRTELERGGPSVLVLRGMDLAHRLMRGTKTRTFADASPLDVARKIAADCGLVPKLEPGSQEPIKAFRFQANQSDFSFLSGLADLEGYWFWVEGNELHLERPRIPDQDDAEFTFGQDLKSFLPVANFRKPLASVAVSTWDPDQKSSLTGEAVKGDQLCSVPGGRAGVELVKFGSAKPTAKAIDSRITSKAHAETVAKAMLTKANQQFLTAEVEVMGDPRLLPGALLNLRNVSVYSGHYLVTEASHFYDAAGYSVICYVARDKWGDSSNEKVKPVREAPAPAPISRPKPEPKVVNPRWKRRAAEGLADLAADLDLPGYDGRTIELFLETRAAGGGWVEVARGSGEVQGGTAMVSTPLGLLPASSALGSPALEGRPAKGGRLGVGDQGVATVSAKGLEGATVSLILERRIAEGWERAEAKDAVVSGGKAEARFSLPHPAGEEVGKPASVLLSAPRWQVAPGDNSGRGWLEVAADGLADGRTVRLLVERLARDGRWAVDQTILAKVSAGRVHEPVDLAHRPGEGADSDRLLRPRWDGKDLAHGKAGTFSAEAPGLDGRRVRFVIERLEGKDWTQVGESLAAVKGGVARAQARLVHPAGEADGLVPLPGARWTPLTGVAEVEAPRLDGRAVRFRLQRPQGPGRWLPAGDVLARVIGGVARAAVRAPQSPSGTSGSSGSGARPPDSGELRIDAELLPDSAPRKLRFRAELLPDLGAQRLRFRAEPVAELRPSRLRVRAELPVPEDPSLTRVRGRLA